MEELTKSITDLKLTSGSQNKLTSLDCVLHNLVQKEGAERQAVVELVVQSGLLELLGTLLLKPDPTLVAHAAQIVAEVAHTEVGRRGCTDLMLVAPLVEALDGSGEVVVQACRALAHICHDNEAAQVLVKQTGMPRIVQLLHRIMLNNTDDDSLRAVAAGCLFHLASDATFHDGALRAGVLDVVIGYLQGAIQELSLASHCLLLLASLAYTDCGRSRLSEPDILKSLVYMVTPDTPSDLLESLLELLGNLAENDGVKYQLAKLQLSGTLLELAEGSGEIIPKMACDLIVLLLTGDASMEVLYQGPIYHRIIPWLAASDDLQIAGALAAGNFARKDQHCIAMVKDGIPKALMEVLRKHVGPDGDIRLQHALLAALRNLAIPGENKKALAAGVVELLLSMLDVETFPVVYKLLATLRMLVDGQVDVANRLARDSRFLSRLSHWACTQDHPGVTGEAVRLLAWVVQSSSGAANKDVHLVDCSVLPSLVVMLDSEHTVMQKEALQALNLISLRDLEHLMEKKDCDLALAIFKKLAPNNAPELIQQAIELASRLLGSAPLRKELVAGGVPDALKELSLVGRGQVKEAANSLLNSLK